MAEQFLSLAARPQGPTRDWGDVMGLGGVAVTFVAMGAAIFALVFVLSKIDKPRRPPGPDSTGR